MVYHANKRERSVWMDTLHYTDSELPIYFQTEHADPIGGHSEMAHWHDAIEIVSVERGSLCCLAGGTEMCLHRGDVCFINRRQLHRVIAEGESDAVRRVLILGPGLLTQNTLVHEKYIRPLIEDRRFSHVRFAGGSSPAAEIGRLMDEIESLLSLRSCGYELEVIALVHRMFRQLFCAYSASAETLPHDGNALLQQKMSEYIYAHYAEPLTLDDIARAGSVSRSQCIKLFNQYTKQSPIAFLNGHRLEVSRDLLRNSSDSILSVAQRCGFGEQSYFNRLFLRAYGCTPSRYRRGGLPADA